MQDTPTEIEHEIQRLIAINKKRKTKLRHKQLLELLDKINNGDFNSVQFPKDRLFDPSKTPRQEYVSPLDRSTRNWGYMEMGNVPEEYL